MAYPIALHRSVLAGKNMGDRIPDILNGCEEGQFGWLRWPNDPTGGTSTALAEALSDPASSCEFQNACDPDDTHLSIGDWIWANTGVSNDSTVRAALDSLIDEPIRVIVWDEHDDNTGANGMFQAHNFAIVKLIDYHLPGTNTISIEFVHFDSTGCTE
jgi:hypothetical protein